jgi:hypothetical protein
MATFLPSENTGFADGNPYAPPAAPLVGAEPPDTGDELAQADSIRRTYLSHEASVKSVGSLHYLCAIFTALGIVFSIAVTASVLDKTVVPVLVGLALFYAVMTGLHVALGIGLRRLQTWARWTEVALISISFVFLLFGVLSIILLAAGEETGPLIPLAGGYGFGGLILAYILYLLVSPKGSKVFSAEYRTIIERTPHIKYRTSLVAKVFLGLLVTLIMLGILAAIVGSRR